MFMSDLGDRIRVARKAAGLTQLALGQLCGVTKNAVTQWETTGSPSKESLIKVAQVTEAPVNWLLFGGPLPEQDANGRFVTLMHRGALVPHLSIDAAVRGDKPLLNARRIQAFFPCGPESYYLTLPNDSNAPKYPSGAIAIMDPEASVEPGTVVLAAVGTPPRAIIGALRYQTTAAGTVTIIEPLNSAWPQGRSDLEPVTILSKLVESIVRG